MTSMPVRTGRGLIALAVVALLVAACGRRGPLEPPVDPSAAVQPGKAVAANSRVRPGAAKRQATTTAPSTALVTRGADVVADSPDSPDSEEEDAEDVTQTVSPIPTPRKRVRTYSVPKEPFVLDPLL